MTGPRRTTLSVFAALLLVAPLALAGCSGSGSGSGSNDSSSGRSGSAPQAGAPAAAWGSCMRDQGFQVEDPAEDAFAAGVDHVPAGVDDAAFQAASRTCRGETDDVTAGGGTSGGASAEQKAGWEQDALDFSKCMRENGVTEFPDPAVPGVIQFDHDDTSPTYQDAEDHCTATVLENWGGL